MSRQRRRPAVGGGSAEVVSIGAGGNHRPDYSRLACGQVGAARRQLGMDRDDFARWIFEHTGWDVIPETVTAWEDDVVPPGDVVIACTAAAQGLPILAGPMTDGRPPAFPAEALAGAWVTSYQFSHAGQPRYHADIAHVTIGPDGRVQVVNHPPEPRSEGRERPFRNEISARLAGRHLVGEWMNTSDTRYHGVIELAVLPGEIVMSGGYMGVGSDVEVSMGSWKWVRVDPGSIPDTGLGGVVLRDPAAVHDLVMSYSEYGEPLALADVREEP